MKNKENVIVKIYELRDPRDPECKPRYVGITTQTLKNRLGGHIYKRKSFRSKTHRTHWVNKLLSENVVPTIHLIERVVGWEYAGKVEQYWIREFKEQGYDLVNGATGGIGPIGFIHSEETRRKMSASKKGSKLKEFHKQKIGNACKKGVIVLKDSGECLTFESVNECSKSFNIPLGSLGRFLKIGRCEKLKFNIKYNTKWKEYF